MGVESLLGLPGAQAAQAGPPLGSVIMSTLGIIAQTLMVIVPIMVVVVLVWRFKKFPVKVLFFRKRGKNVELDADKAGRIKEKGVFKYKFMKFKNRALRIQPPELGEIYTGPKGNHLFLFEDDAGIFRPITLHKSDNPGIALAPVSKAILFWQMNEIRDDLRRYEKPNMLLQYMPVIGIVLCGIFIVLMLVLVKGDLSATAKVVSQAIVKAAEIANPAAGAVAPGY